MQHHRSLMREMMGGDPFDDPFFREPFGMMGGMPGMVRAHWAFRNVRHKGLACLRLRVSQ